MARVENTKMTVSLDNDSKRLIRNLTRAIDRLASRKWDETCGASGVKRLTEPADDPALSDDNENHSQELSEDDLVEYDHSGFAEVTGPLLGKYNALR